MRVICRPARLSGRIAAIPSKSDAHRVLIAAALADRPTQVAIGTGLSADITATLGCLRALGARFEASAGGRLRVTPVGQIPENPTLDCGESGATLRFMLPVAAALGCGARFVGSGRLPRRPIAPLLGALAAGGVQVSGEGLPLCISGRLAAGRFALPGDVSSQFISGMLLALPRVAGGGEIAVAQPLESAAYVAMTLGTLARFGVAVEADGGRFAVPPGQAYRSPGEVAVEGDWSNMAFFLAAGALAGPVRCEGLDAASRQGDAAIVALLQAFGAQAERSGAETQISAGRLRGLAADVREIPDLAPILAVVAAAAEGESLLTGCARLRLKESDRLRTVAGMLRALGGRVEEGPDFLRIAGGVPLRGGRVDCAGDHRIAMAGAIAATLCRGETVLEGAGAVNKSYPQFFEDYAKLGGKCHVVQHG